jgi:hypothetical protein
MLVAQLLAAVGVPGLHQLHHARYGADHVHDASGRHGLAAHHGAFDADLEALGLAQAAAAGALAVDCALANFTLADCTELPDHPHGFGDELLARSERAPPPDPLHGTGALEHFHTQLIPTAPVLLPPPALPLIALLSIAQLRSHDSPALVRSTARGPPR